MYPIASTGYSLATVQELGDLLSFIYICAGIFITLFLIILPIAGMWQIFVKAGEAGWKAIIPIYNIWILCEIIGRPGWWVILYFIPLVNFIVWIIMMIDLPKSLDRGIGFAIGLMLFPAICYPILGFSEMQYYGPAAKS